MSFPGLGLSVLGAACLSVAGLFCGSSQAAERPNIIFFFTDDQGWGDVGAFGHPYLKTPAFDRLAKEGTRFNRFYSASSVCSPSRAAFMTGKFPARYKIHGHFGTRGHNNKHKMPHWLDTKTTLVTRVLQQGGYRIGHFGKWHLGHVRGAPGPDQYGIDDTRILAGNGPGWDRMGKPTETDVVHASYTTAAKEDRFWTHSTELIVDEAIAFMKANKDKPFYLNLWTILPHAPNVPTTEQLAAYKDLKVNSADFGDWMKSYIDKSKDPQKQMETYLAGMAEIDIALGRLLTAMDELKLTDNTFFFFTSDNGPEDYHIRNVAHSGLGSPGPFRGRKRSLYEGGIRMPCIARWPDVIPAGKTDETSTLAAVDWLPTVCAITGVANPEPNVDGESVLDILKGTPRERQKPLFWEWKTRVHGDRAYHCPQLAMMDGKWKLLQNYSSTRIELYDIEADPEERANIAGKHADVVARMSKQLLAWKAGLPK